MPVSDSFRSYALEQLDRAIGPVRARSMFGGVGLYAGEHFFALIADDTLYLKTDDSTRSAYETRGMRPFQPFGDKGSTMRYHELPADVLENPDELRGWASRAVDIARRTGRNGRGRSTRPAR